MEGRRLVDVVRKTERVLAAFWFYDTEAQKYQIVLAIPEPSPLAAYGRVQTIFRNLRPPSSIRLEDLRILKESDPLVTTLRLSIGLPGNEGLRLSDTNIEPFYITDAFIYCLEPVPPITDEQNLIMAVKNGTWRAVPATFRFRIGLLQEIETTGFAVPSTKGNRGLNVDVFLITDITDPSPPTPGAECKSKGKVIQKVFRDGRLMQLIPREDNVEITMRFDEHGKLIA